MFRHTSACLSAAALAALLHSAAHVAPARAQAIELDTILVEGTSLDAMPQAAGRSGSAVTVVTADDLQRQQVRHAADALRSLPGVAVGRAGSFGGLTQVRIRGGEGNHTLVLIDGVEANTATEGEFDFSNLLAEDIERIEVIRGPQSGLYGSGALAGVINIITKPGRGPLSLRASGEGGSFNSRGAVATLAGGTDALHGRLTVQRRETDGFNISPSGRERDGAEIGNASFKGGVRVTDALTIDGTMRFSRKHGERDDQIASLDRLGALEPNRDTESHFDSTVRLAGAEATLTLLEGRWVQKFRAGINDTVNEDVAETGFTLRARNDSFMRQLAYVSTFHKATPGFLASRHSLTGLVERQEESFTPVTDDNITRNRRRVAFAAEYRGDYFDHLSLSATLRHDDNDTLSDFTTYRLAGSLAVPGSGLRLHASAGEGVKFPTLFEQFGTLPSFGFVPNPGLVPEESFGWDAGVETSLFAGRVVVDVTYFEADLENQIRTQFAPVFTAVNLPGTSRREGIEVSGTWRPVDWFWFRPAYTWLDARDPAGLREIRRPEHSARVDAGVSFAGGRGALQLGVAYNGDMDDLALRNASFFGFPGFVEQRVRLDSYTLVTLAGSYTLKPGMEVFGRVENLLDRDYQEVFGFESAGIAAYGGMRIRLGLAE